MVCSVSSVVVVGIVVVVVVRKILDLGSVDIWYRLACSGNAGGRGGEGRGGMVDGGGRNGVESPRVDCYVYVR